MRNIRSAALRFVLAATFLCGALGARAQVGQQQFAEIGDLKLENGKTLKSCRVGYRTYGVLNAEGSNAVLFPTWFGGKSEDLAQFIGQGRLIDTGALYVIAVDALGNGVSSSPSNSKEQPGTQFPAVSIRDMVESQYRLLTDVLKIKHLRVVAGVSMGGMQAFQWMFSHPDFLDRAIPMVGTPKQTAQDLLLWKSQLRTILDHRGSPEEVKRGMRAVARIHALHLYTPAYRVAKTKPLAEETLEAHVEKMLETQEKDVVAHDAEDWAVQLTAMIGHDVYRPFGGSEEMAEKTLKAKALVVVVTTDHMVNPAPALRFAERTKSRSLALINDGGHLGLSQEFDKVITAVREFLYARD